MAMESWSIKRTVRSWSIFVSIGLGLAGISIRRRRCVRGGSAESGERNQRRQGAGFTLLRYPGHLSRQCGDGLSNVALRSGQSFLNARLMDFGFVAGHGGVDRNPKHGLQVFAGDLVLPAYMVDDQPDAVRVDGSVQQGLDRALGVV